MVEKILIIVGASIALIAILYLVFEFVVKRQNCKKRLRDLDKKFAYLKNLLTGQDAQSVRRLEVISRSNLLYGELYDKYQKEFKTLLEDYCKPSETALTKLRAIVSKKRFNLFRAPYNEAKKAIGGFENRLLVFDKEIYNLLKPEEDSRSKAVEVKEAYRSIKNKYAVNTKELEIVSDTFTRVFAKIDAEFDKYEGLLECADYSEAQEFLPKITQVITALSNAISELPNLCSQIEKVIPEKIMVLGTDFIDVEKRGIPLFHLGYKKKAECWYRDLNLVKEQIKQLKVSGAQLSLDKISKEIDEMHKQLDDEVISKSFFESNINDAYAKVIVLEKDFLKIVAKLPEVNAVYVISDTQRTNLEILKGNINELGVAKRSLDNYIHSATKQPYSILKAKLEQLISDFEIANQGVEDFKAYVESIKGNSEDAYSLVFSYFYRLKKIESVIREMNMPNLTDRYDEPIEKCYSLLNTIDNAVKTQPIDVKFVNEKVEELKTISKLLFDDVEKQFLDMKLAESAIVYNNQDRIHQSDVHLKLNVIEQDFYNGDFTKVYRTANEIFQNSHVEDNK